MSDSFRSYDDYAQLVFSTMADRPSVERHTLTIYTTSRTVGILRGHIFFTSGHILRIFEQVDFVAHRIINYFYELTTLNETLWWYDPMPHPNDPELQNTHPHHKHIPPDIKHHRVLAPDISFTEPNLPKLVAEVDAIA